MQLSYIRDLLTIKQRVAAAVTRPEIKLHNSNREFSEGLARSIVIDNEEWFYYGVRNGFQFTNTTQTSTVFISTCPERNSIFNSTELTKFLACKPQHKQINELAVDSWLTKAYIKGLVLPHKETGFFSIE